MSNMHCGILPTVWYSWHLSQFHQFDRDFGLQGARHAEVSCSHLQECNWHQYLSFQMYALCWNKASELSNRGWFWTEFCIQTVKLASLEQNKPLRTSFWLKHPWNERDITGTLLLKMHKSPKVLCIMHYEGFCINLSLPSWWTAKSNALWVLCIMT